MHERLRAETRWLHRRVERASPFGPQLGRASYVQHLVRRLGFQAGIEPALQRWLDPLRWSGASSWRDGAALLRADLAYFGWSSGELEQVPVCLAAGQVPSLTAALGGAYVLAGASLGGHSVAPEVARRLGLREGGLAFLRGGVSCAEQARARFEVTLRGIGELAAELGDEGRVEIAAGARATFSALAEWLEGP